MTSSIALKLTGLPAAVMLFTMLISASSGHAVRASDYRLDTMDKLHIRVVEWQTAEGAMRDWSMVSGEYTVGPSGNISLPFIGEMPATGRTTAQIAAAIGDELQQKFGLLDRPEASVELAEFRPVFISGEVQTPGKYPYDPGLTVLKAVSVAGGLRRSSDGGLRIERDFINASGQYEIHLAERNRLLAKRARLVAEADGRQEIEPPQGLEDNAQGKSLLSAEAALLTARERRLRAQLGAIEDLKTLLQNEIVSLEKKIATQNRQMELAREELEGIGGLAERGLVVNARVLSIERSIAEMEGKILDMETAALRAKQDISRASQDATNLQTDRETEISQQRQQAEAEIEALNLKIAMYRNLMSEAVSLAPEAALRANEDLREVTFTIVRTTDGQTTEMAADESTSVLPGDVVKVGISPTPGQ
jgi:exopolysaccharide production protein ExoF